MKETRPHRLTTRINRCTAASAIFVVASTAFHPPVGPILRLARSLRYILCTCPSTLGMSFVATGAGIRTGSA